MLWQDAWLGKSCPLSAMTLMSSLYSLTLWQRWSQKASSACVCSADTPAATFGIGKIKALKVARTARIPLHAIGDTADEAIVPEQATSLILACYGKGFSSVTRIKMWWKKIYTGSALKLCSMPSTTEAFTENAKRAHLQAAHWKASIEGTVPPIDALTHGSEHRGNPVCHSCCLAHLVVKEATVNVARLVVLFSVHVREVRLTKKLQESVPVDDDNDDNDEL